MNPIAVRSRTLWTLVLAVALAACTADKNTNITPAPPAAPDGGTPAAPPPDPNKTAADSTFDQGKDIFRNDTFGDEPFWTGVLQLNKTIEGQAHGGVGAGVSPKAALGVGLKVDIDALPASVVAGVQNGSISLDSPDTTIALIKLGAVLGLKGTVDSSGALTSLGVTCAVCHSTVDNAGAAVAPGIGHRLDGWPNRDLNVGGIISLSPPGTGLVTVAQILSAGGTTVDETAVRSVLASWGPGKFDAELFLDEKTTNPATGQSAATLIPPAFGLRGVNLHTWTGWGSITQWNAFVAVLEMHGQGSYTDARLDDAAKFPVAAALKLGHTTPKDAAGNPAPDLVSSKLGPLEFYQLALEPPKPAAGSFDAAAATRGQAVFNGPGKCATCHTAPLYTDAGWNMHTGAEIGIEDFQALRTPNTPPVYRTSPLRGLIAHAKGAAAADKFAFYHDGRFKGPDMNTALKAVIDHYAAVPALGISFTGTEEADLIEYLKSL